MLGIGTSHWRAFQSCGTESPCYFDAVKFFAKPRFLRAIFLGPKQNLKADFINRPSLFLSQYIYKDRRNGHCSPANPYQRTSNADQLAIFLPTMPHCADRIGPNHRRSRHWCRQTSEVTRHFWKLRLYNTRYRDKRKVTTRECTGQTLEQNTIRIQFCSHNFVFVANQKQLTEN